MTERGVGRYPCLYRQTMLSIHDSHVSFFVFIFVLIHLLCRGRCRDQCSQIYLLPSRENISVSLFPRGDSN